MDIHVITYSYSYDFIYCKYVFHVHSMILIIQKLELQIFKQIVAETLFQRDEGSRSEDWCYRNKNK